ncbi:MAG: hypothetical protein ACK5X3_20415 [Pseudomonadota bacterium]
MIPVSGQPNGQGGPAAPAMGGAGGIGGPSASPPGGSPRRQRRVAPPNTFAGMQQQGLARPTPQMVQAQQNANQLTALNQQMQQQAAAAPAQGVAPTADTALASAQQTVNNAAAGRNLGLYQQSGNVQALGNPLMQQVMTLLQDPTQGLNEAAQSNFDRQNRVLDREFSTLRDNLNENMAARGLDASTIAATRLGELGARQAEAQADVSARIQEQLIRDRAGAMQSAINSALGLRGQEADLGQQEFVLNRDTGEMEWRRNFDASQSDRQADQFDRRLGLDTELGRGNLAINQQQLGLARDRFGFDQQRDARDFGYQQERDTRNDAFRDREFDWRQSTDTRDFNRLTERDRVGDQQWQSNFDRQGQWRGEDVAYRDRRDTVQDDQWQRGFDRQDTWRTQDNQYRDGRDAIQDTRWNQSWDRDQTRWDQTRSDNQTNTRNSMLFNVLSGMGFDNMSPEAMTQVFSTLGIEMPDWFLGAATSRRRP